MLVKSRKGDGIWGLRLDGSSYLHAGEFWKPSQTLKQCWQVSIWAKFHSLSGDIISGGQNPDAIRVNLTGGHFSCITGGQVNITKWYSGTDPMQVPLGQICHITVGFNHSAEGQQIEYFVNGMLAGYSLAGVYGGRITGASVGPLFIGKGCDMTVYQIRLFAEMYNPTYPNSMPTGGVHRDHPFHPERQGLAYENYSWIDSNEGRPCLFYDFTTGEGEGLLIPDLGEGYKGGNAADSKIRHPGRFCHSSLANNGNGFSRLPIATAPRWEYETDHPFYFDRRAPIRSYRNLTPPSPPVGAVVYDSFSREDVSHATHPNLQNYLGSTESGSAGPKVWRVTEYATGGGTAANQLGFGINNGYLIKANHMYGALADVDAGISDVDITLTQGATDAYGFGIAFRTTDSANTWVATAYYSAGWYWESGKIVGGVYTSKATTTRTPVTNTVRVVASGSTISVYDGATLVHTYSDSFNSGVTRHGIYTYAAPAQAKESYIAKVSEFLIKAG